MSMRILFICGSLEPGKDGVGDYSRILGSALIEQGYDVEICSLYDKSISVDYEFEVQKTGAVYVKVHRFQKSLSAANRRENLISLVNSFKPDWCSLQYVPYSYDPKGLPLNLGKLLQLPGAKIKWHIMFHELWIYPTGVKDLIIQKFQKLAIQRLINTLKPDRVSTQNPNYLSKIKIFFPEVQPLEIFSNIKPVRNNFRSAFESKSSIRIVLFSQMESKAQLFDFLIKFQEDLFKRNIDLEIVLTGGGLTKQELFKNQLLKQLPTQVTVILKGFLSDIQLSDEFEQADMGLTSVPYYLAGKSGSVHAFLEHHLPVACPVFEGNTPLMKPFFTDTYKLAVFYEPDYKRFVKALRAAQSVATRNIAKEYIEVLK